MMIMLGTNDSKCRYGVSAAEIGFGLEDLIQKVETFSVITRHKAGPAQNFCSLARFPCGRRRGSGDGLKNP